MPSHIFQRAEGPCALSKWPSLEVRKKDFYTASPSMIFTIRVVKCWSRAVETL